MAIENHSQRMEFKKKRFGVAKWHYKQLDCIDLFIKLLILTSCQLMDKCRPCRHLLRFRVNVLRSKWDDIRFIDFDEALALAKYLKVFMQYSVSLEHYKMNWSLFKKNDKKSTDKKNALDVLSDNTLFFLEGIGKHLHIRTFLYNIIASTKDIYNVNDFKDDLVFT